MIKAGRDKITQNEAAYLQELAKKQKEYSQDPIMEKRKSEWYRHNAAQGERPMIVMEEETFWNDIRPEFVCQGEWAQEIENQLLQNLYVAEEIRDDKVIPDFYRLEVKCNHKKYGIDLKKTYAKDHLGFHIEPELTDLDVDLHKLKRTEFSWDEKFYKEKEAFIKEILGDILPVKRVNGDNYWDMALTADVVSLMGTENMFCAMLETPDEYHKMMDFLADEKIRFLRWQEKNHLLYLNNGNDYMGSGSYCFSKELPSDDYNGIVKSIHTWGHMNSQESVGISPSMFREFVLPPMVRLSKEFGLLYYGCCEPVSDFWDDGVETLHNLRKVSISAWCSEEKMSERLQGTKIIYSRKPSPNFIGIQKEFDSEAFRKHIRKTVQLARSCKCEFIFRDIYKLHGNRDKIRQAVDIAREEIEK